MRYADFMETKGGREIANYSLDRATKVYLKVSSQLPVMLIEYVESHVNGQLLNMFIFHFPSIFSEIEQTQVALKSIHMAIGFNIQKLKVLLPKKFKFTFWYFKSCSLNRNCSFLFYLTHLIKPMVNAYRLYRHS
jgi:hypothetical protein